MNASPILIDDELLRFAKANLMEGESLQQFVESAINQNVLLRRQRQDLLTQALTARDNAKCSGRYRDVEDVLARLEHICNERARSGSGAPDPLQDQP